MKRLFCIWWGIAMVTGYVVAGGSCTVTLYCLSGRTVKIKGWASEHYGPVTLL